MTIRDPKKYMEGVWDWGILRGCFGETRIEPTDLDGITERKGRFLVLETKSPSARIPLGQQILFEALRRTGLFTIFIVWGPTDTPQEIQIMTRHKIHEKEACDIERFRAIVAQWFEHADKNAEVRLN